jgi:hypothetical protein
MGISTHKQASMTLTLGIFLDHPMKKLGAPVRRAAAFRQWAKDFGNREFGPRTFLSPTLKKRRVSVMPPS